MFLTQNTPRSGLARAYRMGGDARAKTIAAWLRTLIDWDVSLERAAEMIEAGVPWGDSEMPLAAREHPLAQMTRLDEEMGLYDDGEQLPDGGSAF